MVGLALAELIHQQKRKSGPPFSKQVSSHQGNRAVGQVAQLALSRTAKQPVGLDTCGPNDGSFFSQEGAYLLGDHGMLSACIHHKVHWMAPYFNSDHGLLGAQLKRAQSSVLGFCSS